MLSLSGSVNDDFQDFVGTSAISETLLQSDNTIAAANAPAPVVEASGCKVLYILTAPSKIPPHVYLI
jgi:hypothetical protein